MKADQTILRETVHVDKSNVFYLGQWLRIKLESRPYTSEFMML